MEIKRILLGILIVVAGFMVGFGYADEKTSELMITVTGFNNSDGVARIALVNSKENYNGKVPFKGISTPIIDQKVIKTINVPYGEYAIKIYHDENNNSLLDKMMFGIPKESYGYSNNARAKFGPPEYEAAAFKVNMANVKIDINVE